MDCYTTQHPAGDFKVRFRGRSLKDHSPPADHYGGALMWMMDEQSSPPVLRKSREGTVWGVVLIGVSVWEQEFPTPLVFYNC